MAWRSRFSIFAILFILHAFVTIASSSHSLSPYYYNKVCPQALPTIKRLTEAAVYEERRMGASLLRLHFVDCFVNGCDASNLLDPSPIIDSEKNARSNNNTARGFEVIDQIKEEVDKICGRPVVSCADILAVAARDSVVALGGPTWTVQLGRRDSTTASRTQANADMPSPVMDLPALISNFRKHGLNEKDLVALSGGHSIGFSKCSAFKNRIFNETNTIVPKFARLNRLTCPKVGGDSNIAPLDPTPARFDTAFFTNLIKKKGLLHSDQQLYVGGSTDELVKTYSSNTEAFFNDFANSMVNMGNIKPLTGNQGQIRLNCRKVNSDF